LLPDFADWLRLEQTQGVGPETARRLLARFGLPEHIFAASFADLCEVVSVKVAKALLSPPSPDLLALIDKTHHWLMQANHHLLTLADADYPPSLLEIPDPPLLLYANGKPALLNAQGIGVVGSRNATEQGVRNAAQFSEALSHAGLMIASGLAAGIDAAAHRGALAGAGSTVAVIGTGIDIVYPARNRDLAHAIAQDGCIVSEYPLGMPAIASNFPRRNRIISGLSCGVLVIEAAAQSGSLITARMSAEQGREVFAIPGSIHSPLSKGCHQLIKQGAKLVESAADILEELRLSGSPFSPQFELPASPVPLLPQGKQAPAAGDAVSGLLSWVAYDPVHADTIAFRSGLDAASLNAELLELELAGHIESLPGGMYRRLV